MTAQAWPATRWLWAAVWVLFGVCGCAGAWSAEARPSAPGVTQQELDRQFEALSQRRSAVSEAYAAEHLLCASRFAVTACELEVAQKRRDALAPLRQEELALKQASHRLRGEDQLARLADKAAAANSPSRQQARSKSLAQQEQRQQRAAGKSEPQRQSPDVSRSAKERQDRIQKHHDKARTRLDAASEADGKRAEHEARLHEAQQHKANRLRELEAGKATSAKPLPLRP